MSEEVDHAVEVMDAAIRELATLREQNRVMRGALEKIDIDNGITSGSIGPLMDVGFSMGWNHARRIAHDALSLLPKEGEK